MAGKPFHSPEVLRQLLRYDPDTGALFWLDRPCASLRSRKYIGTQAFRTLRANGYLAGEVQGKKYLAHRAAWAIATGAWPDGEIDHINGDRADNRLNNLRVVNHGQNSRNMKRYVTNTSGAVGVVWNESRGVWQARIKVNYRLKHLGAFRVFEDAVASRRAAEVLYGFHTNHGRE